ncbi:MAG: hypothetical protein QXD77_00710 [Candidatus Aenigmatarchaeota archaeon]
MAYTIGVSSGIFRAAGEEQKGEYVGLPHKAMFSMFKGVMFTQLDLETLSEFKEPDLDKKMEEVRKMGIKYGIHGEVPEYSSAFPKLDSAIAEEWKRTHDRFIEEIKGTIKVKAEYLLFHSATSDSFLVLWREFQSLKICDIWGRLMKKFLEENDDLLEWAISKDFITSIVDRRGTLNQERMREYARRELIQAQIDEGKKQEELKKPTEEEVKKKAVADAKKEFLSIIGTDDFTYGTERVAYYIIAKWMQDGGKTCPPELHTLWTDIAGGGDINDEKFRNKFEKWVPAVTAAYHWGHFYPEKCPTKLSGVEDPKPLLTKSGLKLLFESPMANVGGEEAVRLVRPTHIYYMVKAINMPLVGIVVDAEHVLSANIDPIEDIKNLPHNAGEKVFCCHVGYPSPFAPAHLPIPIGSEAHLYVYKLLWELRKKGMKDAIIIFERGGGQEPVKESILAIRLIAKNLEKDTPPEQLPEEFFGIPAGGPEITRQIVSIKEHALDPLKGLLSVPEEEYGFLSTAAAAKGKIEEWAKRKLK